MEDFNLRQRLGIIMMTPQLIHCQKVIRDLRFKQTAVTAQWRFMEPTEGQEYRWGWFDGVLQDVAQYTTDPPLANMFLAPAWVDTSLHPRGEEGYQWVPNLPDEKVPQWKKFMRAFCERYHQKIKYYGFDTETNVDGLWKNTPQKYAENVILPAAEIVHEFNGKVIAPGITIQKFESTAHYDKSRAHMKAILAIAGDQIDVKSMHSYGKSPERVIDQNYSFIKDCELKAPIWVTETGFPEDWYWVEEDIWGSIADRTKSGQQRQLERFQKWLPVVETRSGIAKQFIYRGWDVANEADKHGTNGMLTPALRQKQAAVYIKNQLMEDRP